MTPNIVALFAGFVVVIGAVLIWNALQRPPAMRRREAISLEQMHTLFYRDTGVSQNDVEEALDVIARAYDVTPGMLRPEDRFAEELSVRRGWAAFDAPRDELSEELRSRFGVDDKSLSHIHCVDDVVRIVAKRA